MSVDAFIPNSSYENNYFDFSETCEILFGNCGIQRFWRSSQLFPFREFVRNFPFVSESWNIHFERDGEVTRRGYYFILTLSQIGNTSTDNKAVKNIFPRVCAPLRQKYQFYMNHWRWGGREKTTKRSSRLTPWMKGENNEISFNVYLGY